MTKPGTPQGMRDFAAETVHKRNFIFSTIRRVFELYGFEPLETPAMENLETLLGKYGEEGDKLIFKVLNNGLSDPKNAEKAVAAFQKVMEGKNSPDLTERALKYDLTIPFARYVAMNHTQLTFPYKRYQMQPVWRADRPQKGRYREFTQCDADVVGSHSLRNEIELANIYHDVFTSLNLNGYVLLINNRKILAGLAALCQASLNDVAIAIDKLEKIGIDKVKAELAAKGLDETQVATVEKYLSLGGSSNDKLTSLSSLFPATSVAHEGIAEIQYLLDNLQGVSLELDLTLARGLNYYTGTIFEVKPPAGLSIGSIGGGGRYDDLTGLFGVKGIPGVGISFGVDRIFDIMEELNLFPKDLSAGPQVLFLNMGEAEARLSYSIVQQFRKAGISSELFHEPSKMDKQLKYADRRKMKFAVIIGSKEMETGEAIVKNLVTFKQESMPIKNLITFIQS